MIRVLFFLPDLNGGGAQRTVINIVNHIDEKCFIPLLVVGSARGPYLETIKKSVEVVDLGRRRVRGAILPLARQIQRWRPEILFSPYPDANVALMLAKEITRWNKPIVLRESNHRTAQELDWGSVKDHLVRWAYRRSTRVVALSNGVRDDLIERYRLSPGKVQTIYNPVDLDLIRTMAVERPTQRFFEDILPEGVVRLIAVGRLVRQKGFDVLIRAISNLRDRPIHLTILGEGEERNNLIRLAGDLGIQDFVSLPGFQKNPYAWMKRSDIFVLSSRWEGFGHVIVEAMACGVAVIAADCMSGPDEIITDGVDGILFRSESVRDLTEKIRFLLENPGEKMRLSAGAVKKAERFDARIVVGDYEDLFRGVIH